MPNSSLKTSVTDLGVQSQDAARLGWVDTLRGVAILLVILVHSGQHGTALAGLPDVLAQFIQAGARGVQLFYLASALAIFTLYRKHREQEKRFVQNFFIRRFFRIAPLYYLVLIGSLFVTSGVEHYWLGELKTIDFGNIVTHFLFLHGFHPYYFNSILSVEWSIAVEMIFYTLVPILFRLIDTLPKAIFAFSLSVFLAPVINLMITGFHPIPSNEFLQSYLEMSLPFQFPIFMLGVLLYFLIRNESLKSQLASKEGRWFLAISVVLLATQFVVQPLNYNLFSWGALFFLLAFGLYRGVLEFVNLRLFQFFGRISYSLYLVHMAAIFILYKVKFFDLISGIDPILVIVNFFVRYLLVLALSTLIASVTYRLIELPMIHWGRWVVSRNERRVS